MLDLMKLAQQMQGISQHLKDEAEAAGRRVTIANQLMDRAQGHQDELVELWETWRDRIPFAMACPVEPLNTCLPIQAAPDAHTVLATDGSQISPSHHEIAYCYLLNVGRIILHYGQSRFPLLDSLPEVVYRPEDLYISRQWGISTEEWMGHRRTVAEVETLADLAEGLQIDTAEDDQPPTLALTDGSLIYWFLEEMPREARDRILPPILEAWDRLQAQRIPLVGYISASRSGEALNFLRLQSCPFEVPDCLTHCAEERDRAPCQVFSPLRDVALEATVLESGQRGPLWRSSVSILEDYGAHHIYFCYVNVGTEVARVEMPEWVALSPPLRDSALEMVITQVQKGYGYPIALAEAHNQAVVRGGDRTRFFALLEREMIRAGLQNVTTSFKEARKRGSIA
ncbi:DNA double-strand break repair nuclease NurA [Leptolyngbya iicbica]|uniref:DNA double-strand break repair nuclease NurA n=2 Tax=Cyanophyceae TaxID=3028117 RepID=A0A4V2E1V5_9CYAN|nr:DNA double-strand break repair nuclease NurA [Leptolyngbya sp. LK]RZM75437.1 DNA double-strand break repair nuclease NurA [Leptolyngbya sp. LK]